METINREELETFVGKSMFLIIKDDGLLRDSENAFYAAVNEQEAAAFCERYKNEHPEYSEDAFSIYKYDVPDVSAFNLLFDGNEEGFQLVNLGFRVNAEELYEKRQNVISKIVSVYKGGSCLFVALNSEMKAISVPVGNTPVVLSFYTNKEDAEAAAENGTGNHTIERWITNLPLDTTIFSVDGEVVYGWEINEAINSVWADYIVTFDYLKKLLEGNKIYIIENSDTGRVLDCDGIPILFSNEAALDKFKKDREELNSDGYENLTVESWEELELLIGECEYTFVDNEEGRFVSRIEDLKRVMGDAETADPAV
ncbi:MAG: hypothetical protein K5769_04900 [Pseudobutyrivibrio sp.]|nr:hypothetical protein [Pseudobutyrivibrio sp.]